MPNLSVPAAVTDRRRLRLAARGILDEPFDLYTGNSGAALTTQVIIGALNGLAAGDVVSNIWVCINQLGVGTVPTTIKVALLDSAGNTLITSINLNTASIWTAATGPVPAPLSAAYTVPVGGGYYACILSDGAFATTPLNIVRANSGSLAPAGKAGAGGLRPNFITTSGKTDISGAIAMVDPGSGADYWIAVG